MPYCQKCGTELVEGGRFCPKCGLARSMNSVSYTDIRLEEFHTGKRVNQVAYVLMAALLGCFGIHKFYAGKIGMGILYLLFCWTFIPGVLGIIEAILGATRKADANGYIYFD